MRSDELRLDEQDEGVGPNARSKWPRVSRSTESRCLAGLARRARCGRSPTASVKDDQTPASSGVSDRVVSLA